jgi:hypothetical protein
LSGLSVTANVTGGNILTGGIVSSTGNIAGAYIIGNGSQLTGVTAYTNANVSTFLAAFGSNTISTTGSITSGNVTGGNVLTGGVVSATGNITGGNIRTAGLISSTGNITSGNISATNHTGTTVSVSGNITGGNIATAGQVSATGNITTANSFVGNLVGTTVSITGNVSAGNVIVNGQPTTYGVANLTTGVVAIQATATGTVATNYLATTRTGTNQTFTGAGDVILNTTDQSVGSSVTYNTSTGVYTLIAGTTYELSFTPSWNFSGSSNDPYVQYNWVDASTNTALDGDSGSAATAYSYQYNYAQHNFNIISKLVYTPSTNQTVKVRVTGTQAGGITTTLSTGSSAYVKAMNAIFALNALDTMTTTGNVTVGGNLTVTGGVRKSNRILTTTATLTVADAGGFIQFNNGPYTVTLPNPTLAANAGIGYRFWQNTASNITLSTPAGAFYGPSGSTTSTKVLAQATTQYWDVWSDGFNWSVFGIKIA